MKAYRRGIASTLAGIGARAALLGLACVSLLSLRLMERGEAYSPRTSLLLVLVGIAGVAAGALVYAITNVAMARSARPLRFLAGALLGAGGVSAGFFALFSLVRNAAEIEMAFDGDDTLAHLFIGMTIDSLGFFVLTGRFYLLPWTLAAIAVAAGTIAAADRRADD